MSNGRGALIQLVAYGASDVFLVGNTTDPYAYNHRNAMMYWFINRECGHAEKDDMIPIVNMPGILDHVPNTMKPNQTELTSFCVGTERACSRIQRAWRNAISNPSYKLCINRLMQEYKELGSLY